MGGREGEREREREREREKKARMCRGVKGEMERGTARTGKRDDRNGGSRGQLLTANFIGSKYRAGAHPPRCQVERESVCVCVCEGVEILRS